MVFFFFFFGPFLTACDEYFMELSHSCPQVSLQKTQSKRKLQLTPCTEINTAALSLVQGGGSADTARLLHGRPSNDQALSLQDLGLCISLDLVLFFFDLILGSVRPCHSLSLLREVFTEHPGYLHPGPEGPSSTVLHTL